jgi:Ni/Co efflux regulator RcnB
MKRFAAAAVALSLVAASVAMADDRHDHDDRRGWSAEHHDFDGRRGDDHHGWQYEARNRYEHDRREDYRHDDRGGWQDHRAWQDRHDDDWRDGRFRRDEYREPWGYRDHDWRRGERLPVAYYAPPYIVGDYRAYGLWEPPYGCHWVRVNNNVVLAAIATGVVMDVVYNAF